MLGSDGETACALLAGNGKSGVLNPSDIFHTACPQMEKSEPARLTYNLEYLEIVTKRRQGEVARLHERNSNILNPRRSHHFLLP